MGHRTALTMMATLMFAAPTFPRVPAHPPQQKDYLSDVESDKIRDMRAPADRIKLYISFAEDRLNKFEYEIGRNVQERRRSDILNGLLNGYVGCVDDAADQIALAQEKHVDIHEALKLMQTKDKAFLETLLKYQKGGPDLETYRDTLDDAIQGTQDALSDIVEAQKEVQTPPVRRKQQ